MQHLLRNDQQHSAPEAVQKIAAVFAADAKQAADAPEDFWAKWARRFFWAEPWQKVLDWNFPDHQWFVGAKTNICYNALDRHVEAGRGAHTALLWISEEGFEQRYSYAELLNAVSKFAAALKNLGLVAGDRAIIYMPLTPEGAIAMLACARIGVIHSVVYAGLGVAALRERIEDADAKIIIAGDIGFRRGKSVDLHSIVEEATGNKNILRIWFKRDKNFVLPENDFDFLELLKVQTSGVPALMLDAEHPLFILYTSGSTGKPKGIVHVHGGYMVGTSYHLRSFFGVQDNDMYWSTSDIGWVVGHSYIVYAPLLEGISTMMREGAPDYPNPGVVWQLVDQHKVDVMFTAPTLIRMCMKFGATYPQAHNLSSLRFLAVAGEPLNPEAWNWAFEHLANNGQTAFIADNWWQTELGAPTIGTPAHLPAKPGSVGVALPGAEAAVVDEHGAAVPANTGGFLALKRPFPHLMRTVWGNHQRYLQYWNELPGNVYTAGDVAIQDSDGYFTVLGRSDDVLNVAGHRIGTSDVESALVSHKSVAEAAVIGIPDAIKGEAIKAFVVLRAGKQWSSELESELSEHVRHELGPIATPSQIVCLDKLPKTRSGKILRRLLKAQALGRDAGDLSTLEE